MGSDGAELARRAGEAGIDLAGLTSLALECASRAAELVAGAAGAKRELVETKSSGTDVVTEVDRASERLLTEQLSRSRPDDAILGEEGASLQGSSGVRWVLDPLDGTTNYLYGLPPYAVSVAAEVNGEPAAAAVVDAATMEAYTATAGSGAWLDGRRLRLGPPPPLATSLIGTGFSYDAGSRRRQAEVLLGVLPEVRDIRRAGSAALDLCYVAAGRLDGFYETGLKHWDWAGGALVATEAGAWVGDLAGGRPGTSILAAAEPLATALRELIGRSGG